MARIPTTLPTSVVENAFTGTDDVSLAAYTPDITYSGGWTQSISTAFWLKSNKLEANRFVDGDLAYIETGLSDFVLKCTVTPFSTSGNRAYPGLVFRYVDSSNFWYIYPDSDNDLINLYRVVAGSHKQTVRMAIPLTSDVDIRMELRCKGPNITIFMDGKEVVTYTSSFNQTATKVGVRVGKSGAPSSAPKWNDLSVKRFYGPNFRWPIFTRSAGNPKVALGGVGTWESSDINNPTVTYDSTNSRYVLSYSGYKTGDSSALQKLGNAYATSLLGPWTKDAGNPVFVGDVTSIQNGGICKLGSTYYYYFGTDSTEIALATSTDLINWTDQGVILSPDVGTWEDAGIFDAFARTREDGKTIELWYAGKPDSTTRHIGLALSKNGTTFVKSPKNPIIGPQIWADRGTNFGEPSIFVPTGKEGKEMLISFDSARGNASGFRFISQALTVDGGMSWHFRCGALEQNSIAGWDDVQVFDSNIYFENDIMYLFHSGADTNGTTLELNIQIGLATAPWPYTSFIDSYER